MIYVAKFHVRGKMRRFVSRHGGRPSGKRNQRPPRRPRPALIPIVTTADTVDAVELAQTYTRRWPVQENSIRDFLLPLGLDTNHGYGKTPIVNSEVGKPACRVRETVEHCRAMDGLCTSSFPQSLSAL